MAAHGAYALVVCSGFGGINLARASQMTSSPRGPRGEIFVENELFYPNFCTV
jgi:hypothetical protein